MKVLKRIYQLPHNNLLLKRNLCLSWRVWGGGRWTRRKTCFKIPIRPDLVFTSLYHHIADIDHLRACYRLLKGNKAVGVDEVTKAMYAEDLEANLHDLDQQEGTCDETPFPLSHYYISSYRFIQLQMRISVFHQNRHYFHTVAASQMGFWPFLP